MEIQKFKNDQFGEIRTMQKDGQVWFVGKDVAEALGYSKPLNALAMHVDEDDSLKQGLTDSLGRTQHAIFINESGLYSLVLSSKLPTAKKFKHWVTSVVLPQIRKTGGYIPVKDDDDEKMILSRALMIAQSTIDHKNLLLEQKESEIKLMAPKAEFADDVTSGKNSILIRDLAKLITQSCGIEIGQSRLFYWLRAMGYLFKNETRPIQKWVEKGLFDTTVHIIHVGDGTKETCTTKVTGKGQQYFIEGFKSGKFTAKN